MMIAGWFLVLSRAHTTNWTRSRTRSRAFKTDYQTARAVSIKGTEKAEVAGRGVRDPTRSVTGQSGDGRAPVGHQSGRSRSPWVCSSSCFGRARWRSRTTTRSCRSPFASPAAIDIGSFAADKPQSVADRDLHNGDRLGRILRIAFDGATARTYRYLDATELEDIRRNHREVQGGSEEMTARHGEVLRLGALALAVSLTLAGCGGDQDRLQQWMEQQSAKSAQRRAAFRAEEVQSATLSGDECGRAFQRKS